MNLIFHLALIWVALALVPSAAIRKPIKINAGLVEGTVDGDATVYRGLPFAAPPVGELRWREPQPVKPWTNTYRADAFKPMCMQVGPSVPMPMPEEPRSEDCLYLNIWVTDGQSDSPLPVIVFFHGGGFRNGSATHPLYSGASLAKNGVIVVTAAYRLGPLGFLAHPELTQESNHKASGNYGLMDMIASLEWVKANIAAFGGDPNRVTVYGQSAGAWAATKLMTSPLAQDLFHRVIAQSGGDFGQSGTNNGMTFLPEAEKNGLVLARGFNAMSIADLRKIPADKITAVTHLTPPIIDGYVIREDTYSQFAVGRQSNVPILLGYNIAEGIHMYGSTTAKEFPQTVRRLYGQLAERVLHEYTAGSDEEATQSQKRLFAERAFGWQTWTWANLHSRKSDVFFNHFKRKEGHGEELPFFFGTYLSRIPFNADRAMSEQVQTYVTNFARTGNPNGSGLPQWPRYTTGERRVMEIGESLAVVDMPDVSEHMLLDEHNNSLRAQAGKK